MKSRNTYNTHTREIAMLDTQHPLRKHAFHFSVINLHFCALLSVMQELHLVRDQLSAEQERASKLEEKTCWAGSELML